MRLFVALELPQPVRSELARWGSAAVGGAASWRLLADANLHVTLCFLGSQDEAAVPAIHAACSRAAGAMAGARLRVGEVVWLPRRSPRVLAVSLEDLDGTLAAVQAALSDALEAGGWYSPERRPFLAHVTVARIRRGAPVRASVLAGPEPVAFVGRAVTLFRSHLGPAGARYEPLGTVELGSG